MKKTISLLFLSILVVLGMAFASPKFDKNTKVVADGETTYEAPVVVTPSDLNTGSGAQAVDSYGRMYATSGHKTWKLKDSVVLPTNNSIEFKALLDFSTWRQTTHSADNKFQVSFSEDQYFGELLIRENKCFVYKDDGGVGEIPFNFLDGKLHLIQYGRKAELVGGTPTGSYLCYLLIDGVEKYSTLRTKLVDALASKGGIGSRYISNCQDSYISFFDPDYEAPTFEKPNEFTIKDLKVGGSYLTSPWSPLKSNGDVNADWNKDFASDSAVFHFVMNLADSGQLAQIGFNGWNNRILVWGENNGTIMYQEDSTSTHNGYRPATGVDLDMEYGCLKITSGENSGKYYLYLKENGVLIEELISTKGITADSTHGVMFFNVKSEGLLTLKDAPTYDIADLDDVVTASMSLAYDYDSEDLSATTNDFRLAVAISEIAKKADAKEFGIEVKANGRTVYLTGDDLHAEDGVFYSVIDLGNVLANDAANANVEFTIRAYWVNASDEKVFGTSTKTYSVKTMVKTYYEDLEIVEVKNLYDMLNPAE